MTSSAPVPLLVQSHDRSDKVRELSSHSCYHLLCCLPGSCSTPETIETKSCLRLAFASWPLQRADLGASSSSRLRPRWPLLLQRRCLRNHLCNRSETCHHHLQSLPSSLLPHAPAPGIGESPTLPGTLNFAPLVEVPAAMFPLQSKASIPIVSWFFAPHSTTCSCAAWSSWMLLSSWSQEKFEGGEFCRKLGRPPLVFQSLHICKLS